MPALSPTRTGIVVFSAVVVAGPWYTVAGYSPISNLISELAAQNTRHSAIMITGFVLLGLGIVVDGVRRFQPAASPFVAFGVFMLLAGLFGHRPIAQSAPYREFEHAAHSILASLAGVSITVGLLWQAARPGLFRGRVVAFVLAVLCVGLPLSMFQLPQYQGLIQRFMYALVFVWLWRSYPALRTADPVVTASGSCHRERTIGGNSKER